MSDALIETLKVAEADRAAASKRVIEAAMAAFPQGSLVTSFHLSKRGCVCRVIGYGHVWKYPGELALRNVKTGKTHRAHPTSPRYDSKFTKVVGSVVELVARADATEPNGDAA